MPKTSWIFIQLILIFKIVFSSQSTIIEMEDVKLTNIQNNQLNNFDNQALFENTNVIKIQSKFKLDNLLIFPSSDKFKYCILPYLSSQSFVKIYLYFQNLIPELNFQKFLPPSRFYTTNNVLDIQEPTKYLQPLEINFLYQFNGEYFSLEPHILYSSKNKITNIFEPDIFIPPDSSFCGHLSQNKIIPYETYVIPSSSQELLILKDDGDDQFFVTFQKSKDQFINIARGTGITEKEFFDYVECIWEAYNLQGWKKNYWKLKSFLTMTYVRYLFYETKIISYFGGPTFDIIEIFCDYCENLIMESNNHCKQVFVCIFALPPSIILYSASFTVSVLWYYATLLPFFILAFPLKHFIFGFNMFSFWFVSQSLASLYVCFFPQITECMPFSIGKKENLIILELEDILPSMLKRFAIKPKKIMSVVPLLVHKKKNCKVKCLNILMLCCLIFAVGFPLSLFSVAFGTYF